MGALEINMGDMLRRFLNPEAGNEKWEAICTLSEEKKKAFEELQDKKRRFKLELESVEHQFQLWWNQLRLESPELCNADHLKNEDGTIFAKVCGACREEENKEPDQESDRS